MQELRLSIGEVAAQADVRTSRIRYYESEGVLPEPERESGQRRYGPEAVEQLNFIAVGQEAGFSLHEISALLSGSRNGNVSGQLRELAERKLPEVEALIERAEAMKRWLQTAMTCGCDTLDAATSFRATKLAADHLPPNASA